MFTFQIIVWKRYNDFKELYKGLVGLHKALHRKDSFPIFAKPKLFGKIIKVILVHLYYDKLALFTNN